MNNTRGGAAALSFFLLFSLFFSPSLHAGPTNPSGEEELFSGAVKPNVLIILDNSNSMDEDFFGNGVGAWASGSKAVEGKKALINLVNTYADTMRLGLMAYRLPAVTAGYMANAANFVSYDPRSYCPDPPDACVEFCRTGNLDAQIACQSSCVLQNPAFQADYIDDSIAGFSYGSPARDKYCGLAYPKKNRLLNPADPGNYLYYKQALPFYSDVPWPDEFDAAPGYLADDMGNDEYQRYATKAGSSDAVPESGMEDGAGYMGYLGDITFLPTDSDLALGYNEFGRRVALFNVGRAWRANTSPGGGYLHVVLDDNKNDNKQLDALLGKLETFENDEPGYMSCTAYSNPNKCSSILSAGLTPTAGTLQSAIAYFQGTYSQEATDETFPSPIQPSAAQCQKNFIVYVTDGLPSVDQNGFQGTADSLMPAVIEKLQFLRNTTVSLGGKPYTYDIKTFIVGVGLTDEAKAKLDAMALSGGTEVSGHAYYADNPAELEKALNQIFSQIQSSTYSFSLPSISSVRIQDENYFYSSSFEPSSSDPFWKGHLEKIQIGEDGSPGNAIWDAGEVLEGTGESSRNIRTYIAGNLVEFGNSIQPVYLGLASTDTQGRDLIVGYIRGKTTLPTGEMTIPNPDAPRKLGDIFHSSPVTIGSPSSFFNDLRDKNQAFDQFRKAHQRTSQDKNRILIVGANDGQLHAFETGEGKEVWSFIPPNLLPKLENIAHSSHPTTKAHWYFVDGPISAADVWWSNGDSDGTAKSPSDWKTLAVFSLGMGVRGPGDNTDYLWSKSPYCDQDFQKQPNASYQYYCGYYALNVTDTVSIPIFQWRLNPDSSQAPYLGEPWSKMAMGRVKIDGNEKWVGFIGGGYTMGTPKSGKKGKGFFVVDLKNGNILWGYTAGENAAMDYIPGSPAIVDRDQDGFIDTAYVGDLSGNLWKFTFCPFDPEEAQKTQKCNAGNWGAQRLFDPQLGEAPVFSSPVVARDSADYWIFWGTGDKANPNHDGPQNRFFALRDKDTSTSYKMDNLQDITSGPFTETGKEGWYINLAGQERILADAAVYRGMVFFTSYSPPTGGNLCGATGSGSLYGISMMPVVIAGQVYDPGKGVFSEAGQRKVNLGAGIPSSPVFSQKPIGSTGSTGESTPDVYVAVSGAAGVGTSIQSSSQLSQVSTALAGFGPSADIIHWKDLRMQ
jgi:type IV pilus assembly protein PilY1